MIEFLLFIGTAAALAGLFVSIYEALHYKPRKITVFVDMDGVLADFDGAVKTPGYDPPEMFEPGFYRNLKVLPNAKWAIEQLSMIPQLELHIGTKHTTKTDYCVSEKVGWIREHFPPLLKSMALVTDKEKLLGDFLIDDDLRWKGFKGKLIHFDKKNPEQEWVRIVHYFKTIYPVDPNPPAPRSVDGKDSTGTQV